MAGDGDQMTADRITLDASPRRRDDVPSADLDGEMVVYEPVSGEAYKLNHLATALWAMLDGSVTLRELSDDMSAALGQDVDQVRQEILGHAKELADAGLLWRTEDGML